MKIQVDYLKKWLNVDLDSRDLRDLLVNIGIEVAATEKVSGHDVLDVEITSNRPDWLSHYGIARELAAKIPGAVLTPMELDHFSLVEIRTGWNINIENSDDCLRYTGCIIPGVEIRASSYELRELLESLGYNSINNVVDVSNLVMLTMGHPTHIFDLGCLQGLEIHIRRARKGEKLTLLDDREVKLDNQHLVIADKFKPVALAGIMGGKDTAITEQTRCIFIESACFNAPLVRRGARQLGIQTDASYRFERGMDIQATVMALKMAVALIRREANRDLEISYYHDLLPYLPKKKKLEMAKNYPSQYTGVEIEPGRSAKILTDLGFGVTDHKGAWLVEVPSWRVDVSEKQDLVEEIIRIHGYDQLKSVLPLTSKRSSGENTDYESRKRVAHYLVSIGFQEVVNYVFQGPEDNSFFAAPKEHVRLKNPIGQEFSVMRNSLIPAMLKNIAGNIHQGFERVAIFEIGNTFCLHKGKVSERPTLSLAAAGQYQRKDWKLPALDFDFAIFKSVLAALFRRFAIPFSFTPSAHPTLLQTGTFSIKLHGQEAGMCGEVVSDMASFYGLTKPVFIAEMSLAAVTNCLGDRRFVMWPKFPQSQRDFSFLLDEETKFHQVRTVLEEIKPETLEKLELVDVYRGANIPSGKISLTLKFTYRSQERTLTGDEVNHIHQGLVSMLARRLPIVPR